MSTEMSPNFIKLQNRFFYIQCTCSQNIPKFYNKPIPISNVHLNVTEFHKNPKSNLQHGQISPNYIQIQIPISIECQSNKSTDQSLEFLQK